jgi:adenylate cyclase
LDPGNAQALAWLAWARGIGSNYGWGGDVRAVRKAAKSFALRAVALDPDDAVAHLVLGVVYAYADNEIEQGLAEVELALHLNPNLALGHGIALDVMILKGDLEAARTHMETASRLSPRDPMRTSWLLVYNTGAYAAGHYEEVVERADEVFRLSPDSPGIFRQRAAALAMLGRTDEARQDIDRLLELIPGNSISQVREQLPWFPDLERFLEGLRKAGLPEE